MNLPKALSTAALIALAPLALTGCANKPSSAQTSTPGSPVDRAMQTHRFEGLSKAELVAASTNTLQELGFVDLESKRVSGVITASRRSKRQLPLAPGQKIAATVIFVGCVAMGNPLGAIAAGSGLISGKSIAEPVRTDATLVIIPARVATRHDSFVLRADFKCTIYYPESDRPEPEGVAGPINTSPLYAEFFERLSKNIFLEQQKI